MTTLANMIPPHVKPEQVFEFDIYADPRIGDDVQGTYSKALKDAPDIFWSPLNGGHWMVQRHDLIAEIVKNPAVFSAREMQIPRVEKPPFMIPLSLDPPDNVPFRHVLMPKFSPRAVAEMEPKMRAMAAEIVDDVAAKGECDFVADVSARFPVSVFMAVMGLPLDKLREFRRIADTYFNARTDEEFGAISAQIFGIFHELIAYRRETPGDDLMTHFLTVDFEGRKLTQDEILAMCFVLFLGGMDTVTNVTGFSFQYLAGDPELQARLAQDPSRLTDFAEEGLRMFGVIGTPRLVVQDFDAHGVSFRKGEMVLSALWQSGRDPAKIGDPDRFDIDRPAKTHLNFSTGPHLCLGHALARAEMRILADEWLKKVPSFRAKPGTKHGFRIGTVIALESLPIEWDIS
ncbi:cytochrome P450 [Novosphingobium sp.]|uniref:cytochrome P450 n=1 Tax=Novosphingobium sp. TaxID=1874826 RepID=UPI00262E3135|nr:cytochrome P450 [Novosphingobium sp.]